MSDEFLTVIAHLDTAAMINCSFAAYLHRELRYYRGTREIWFDRIHGLNIINGVLIDAFAASDELFGNMPQDRMKYYPRL